MAPRLRAQGRDLVARMSLPTAALDREQLNVKRYASHDVIRIKPSSSPPESPFNAVAYRQPWRIKKSKVQGVVQVVCTKVVVLRPK